MQRQILLPIQPLRFFPQRIVRQYGATSFLRRTFKEGDSIVLREKQDNSNDGLLLTLDASETKTTHRGVIKHSDIIGKRPRQTIQSSKHSTYRIHETTLADHVRLTPRLVTPIYPSDANLIVSLLDIHVDSRSRGPTTDPPLEILEAGTGHGALTLHLSRAIHAANSPVPCTRTSSTSEEQNIEDAVYVGESVSDIEATALEAWKANRRAILHTLDISEKYSKHARKIVQGFRQGLYANNVEFHVGDISLWIADQKTLRKTVAPFLTHVILDLPNAAHHLDNIASVLHVNGLLAVFNPSITQITGCVEAIREHKKPYILEQVIELGASTIREWDVRAVRPRASDAEKNAGVTCGSKASQKEKLGSSDECDETDVEPIEGPARPRDDKLVMVCRPKVGQMVVGGGFLGLWRRMEQVVPQGQETDSVEAI